MSSDRRSIVTFVQKVRAFILMSAMPKTPAPPRPSQARKPVFLSALRLRVSTAFAQRRTARAVPGPVPHRDTALTTPLAQQVEERLGTPSLFYSSAAEAPGLDQQLWEQAKAAYLDIPLPSVFKERLFVHLSRFCEMRYCIVRHVGFLVGRGHPSGDPSATPETIEQAIELLCRPVPNVSELEAALARLEAYPAPDGIPAPRTLAESDLFDALTVMFVVPTGSMQARNAVRRAVGNAKFEFLAAFLAFIRTAHYWTETHPDLPFENDMILLMAQRKDLARLLLDTAEAERVHAGDALREALTGQLQVLNTELQHRTRNLLSVIQAVFDRTLSKHRTLENFAEVFSARLDALSRVQTYLSRLVGGEKVTFDGLLRTELAAHAASLRQITLDGPDGVRLRSTTLQTFALAIHELAVNAVKYGALSCPSAHLTVRWRLEYADGRSPLLHVHWQESGVDMQRARHEAVHGGYGRELIERALPYQLKAKTNYVMTPEGVRCSISVPVLA
ncbi:sensor histidine kinase [Dyella jejuensis]|uniref:histidine kinase n=1 Tax=Dyella jejuensis TaxID=1432009 RepID=A0ABW8JI50_9GAMM